MAQRHGIDGARRGWGSGVDMAYASEKSRFTWALLKLLERLNLLKLA